MKKIFYAIAFLCASSFAAGSGHPYVNYIGSGHEYCYYGDNSEKICTTSGYVCEVGINPGRNGGGDAMFFYLGTTPDCEYSNWYNTAVNDMKTCVFAEQYDANGNLVSTSVHESVTTKFFLNNDTQYAGPLAMTVTGSIALSAYNNRTLVNVLYTKVDNKVKVRPDNGQNCLEEHSGIRVLALQTVKYVPATP